MIDAILFVFGFKSKAVSAASACKTACCRAALYHSAYLLNDCHRIPPAAAAEQGFGAHPQLEQSSQPGQGVCHGAFCAHHRPGGKTFCTGAWECCCILHPRAICLRGTAKEPSSTLQADGGYQEVPGSDFEVGREAHRDNASHYFIDGRKQQQKVGP